MIIPLVILGALLLGAHKYVDTYCKIVDKDTILKTFSSINGAIYLSAGLYSFGLFSIIFGIFPTIIKIIQVIP